MGRSLAWAIVLAIPAAWVYVQVTPAAHASPPAAVAQAVAPAPASAPVPSGPGVTYSFGQLAGALETAGVPAGARSHTGAAIARAESGGRSAAICDSCAGVREYSVGPWQLNLLAHPWVTAACAMALQCAAAAASTISGRGSNWTPWSTYNSGAWRRYYA